MKNDLFLSLNLILLIFQGLPVQERDSLAVDVQLFPAKVFHDWLFHVLVEGMLQRGSTAVCVLIVTPIAKLVNSILHQGNAGRAMP